MAKQVFKNVNLIDGKRDHPIKDSVIIVENGKVTYVGQSKDNTQDDTEMSTVFDLKGMTMLPGMIDAHIHLSWNGDADSTYNLLMEDSKLTLIKAINRAKKELYAGFTTVRTMGEREHIDLSIKKAIEQDVIEGPRIVGSGNALTITGGHGDLFPHEVKANGISIMVDGEDEVRKGARKQLKLGADNIKLMATGGGTSVGPADAAEFTVKEMQAAVESAEEFGKITGAHAIGSRGIKNALAAGVRTIEHGTFLDEEGINLLLEKEAYLVPTLSAFKTLKYGEDGGVPKHQLEKVEYYRDAHYSNLKKAIKAGVKIAVGTDAGTPFNHHGENAYELSGLISCGMSPMEAIKSATKRAAEALNIEKLGSIEKGNIADMLVVNGDPSKDVNILQDISNIKMIFKNGQSILKR